MAGEPLEDAALDHLPCVYNIAVNYNNFNILWMVNKYNILNDLCLYPGLVSGEPHTRQRSNAFLNMCDAAAGAAFTLDFSQFQTDFSKVVYHITSPRLSVCFFPCILGWRVEGEREKGEEEEKECCHMCVSVCKTVCDGA